jgi:hypothetical protein
MLRHAVFMWQYLVEIQPKSQEDGSAYVQTDNGRLYLVISLLPGLNTSKAATSKTK